MSPQELSSPKPTMRGLLHEIAFFVSLMTGPILVIVSRTSDRLGTGIYSVALSAMFGVSALYHRPDWRPSVRNWLRKLDHSMILVLIAGTFTPIALALHHNGLARVGLSIVWLVALAGTLAQMLPLSIPKPLVVIPYLALGWFGALLFPSALRDFGVGSPLLLLIGGVLYTVGAIAYARRSPNPKPGIFGYHEVFHAFVIAAAASHYAAIAVAVA
ncbi:MAG: hemolysin III family protein [Actinomycetota bacterium]|nr:hemolysin III family protein [Actinomycetota bacterium]